MHKKCNFQGSNIYCTPFYKEVLLNMILHQSLQTNFQQGERLYNSLPLLKYIYVLKLVLSLIYSGVLCKRPTHGILLLSSYNQAFLPNLLRNPYFWWNTKPYWQFYFLFFGVASFSLKNYYLLPLDLWCILLIFDNLQSSMRTKAVANFFYF